jgi:hypothetical protein
MDTWNSYTLSLVVLIILIIFDRFLRNRQSSSSLPLFLHIKWDHTRRCHSMNPHTLLTSSTVLHISVICYCQHNTDSSMIYYLTVNIWNSSQKCYRFWWFQRKVNLFHTSLVELDSVSPLILDGGKWSTSCLGHFTSKKEPQDLLKWRLRGP